MLEDSHVQVLIGPAAQPPDWGLAPPAPPLLPLLEQAAQDPAACHNSGSSGSTQTSHLSVRCPKKCHTPKPSRVKSKLVPPPPKSHTTLT